MSYLTFHLVFLAPPIALMLFVHRRPQSFDAEVIVEGLRAPMDKQHQCYRRRQKNEMEGKVAH